MDCEDDEAPTLQAVLERRWAKQDAVTCYIAIVMQVGWARQRLRGTAPRNWGATPLLRMHGCLLSAAEASPRLALAPPPRCRRLTCSSA